MLDVLQVSSLLNLKVKCNSFCFIIHSFIWADFQNGNQPFFSKNNLLERKMENLGINHFDIFP